PVWREHGNGYRICMATQHKQSLARSRIQKPRCSILGYRYDAMAVRAERCIHDCCLMPAEDGNLSGGRNVPYPRCVVALVRVEEASRRRNDAPSIGTE